MDEINVAEEVIDGRKCQNTKIQYRRKFAHFEKWIHKRYPSCYDVTTASVVLLSIQKIHILEFFGLI